MHSLTLVYISFLIVFIVNSLCFCYQQNEARCITRQILTGPIEGNLKLYGRVFNDDLPLNKRIKNTSKKNINSRLLKDAQKEWKSISDIIRKRSSTKRPGTVWWMKEDQLKNPDSLPKYEPWWIKIKLSDFESDKKLVELKKLAKSLGLSPSGNKNSLLSSIRSKISTYSLSNENYKKANFNDDSVDDKILKCYPENYDQ